MPFSNPSYFGPARNLDRIVGQNAGLLQTGDRVFLAGLNAGAGSAAADLIVIGSGALDAGLTDTDAVGTIAIGVNALSSLVASPNTNGGSVAIGRNVADALTNAARMVLVGTQAMMNVSGTVAESDNSVVIGYRAASLQNVELTPGIAFVRDTVAIGYEAGRLLNPPGTNTSVTLDDSVFIGHQAGLNYNGIGSNREHAVIIGRGAGANGFGDNDVIIGSETLTTVTPSGAAGQNVIIGANSEIVGLNASNNVVLGFDTTMTGSQSVVIGALADGGQANGNIRMGYACGEANTGAGQGNVLLGAHAALGSGAGAGMERNICIGYGAGRSLLAALDDIFLVEVLTSGQTGTLRRMLYGSMATGNIIIGNAPNADLNWRGTTQPTNALKLINGTVGTGTNPSNGGFFYVNAGVLHWFDQSGIDMSLSVPVAGQLASTSIGYTDGAAAAAGTLTNAPAAGNPAKWIPINDNGTIRYIPAW